MPAQHLIRRASRPRAALPAAVRRRTVARLSLAATIDDDMDLLSRVATTHHVARIAGGR